jgi:hypothetical protein
MVHTHGHALQPMHTPSTAPPPPFGTPTPCRRRGIFDTDFLALLAHVLLGTILSKVVPFLYGAKPALLQLGAGLPYSKILKAVRRDATAAAVGLAAVGVWLGTRIAARLATGGAA